MTALFDAPGPRARRRIRTLTAVSYVSLAVLLGLAVWRFGVSGQLDPEKWSVFRDPIIANFLLQGLESTLLLALVAGLIALPFAVVLALGRVSSRAPLRWLAGTYVEVFRAIPLFLKILFFVLVLPALGLNVPIFWKACIPIVLSNAATMAEVFRAGIAAIPRGQLEAALSLGMRRGAAMWQVMLPQALRVIVPTLASQLISLLKDTTLAFAVSYPDLFAYTLVVVQSVTIRVTVQAYIVVAGIYLALNLVLSLLGRWLEHHLQRRGGTALTPQTRRQLSPTGGV